MFSMKKDQKLHKNWSGIAVSTPKTIEYPSTVEGVIKLVKICAKLRRRVRVVGAGHSFTPIAQTSDVLVSLDRLSGVDEVDAQSQIVEVWAGTKLKDLSEMLYNQGWAQENLGDIDSQSIAGAISTGTHGTGIQFGSLSAQIVEMQVVTASGDIMTLSEQENPYYFKAAQVSLGMLGIIVKVKLRVVPATVLHYESQRFSVSEVFERLEDFRDYHDHFEFYWFPHTDTMQVKLLDKTDEKPSDSRFWNDLNQLVMENGLFGVMSRGCRMFPKLCKPVSHLSARFVPVGNEIGYSHQLFTTSRLVRFNEMEYSVPAEEMEFVVSDIRQCVADQGFDVHFPIEYRYVKGDDIWLSPAYGRDSAYIAVHMYKGMAYKKYFSEIEKIFHNYCARPHWGKLHTRTAEELAKLYPKWKEFQTVRNKLDPQEMFLNSYLKKRFTVGE